MSNLERAQIEADLNLNDVEYPVLLGMLKTFKQWIDSEPHLIALGKESILQGYRDK